MYCVMRHMSFIMVGHLSAHLGLKPDDESMQRLLAKHPEYLKKVMAFIKTDPLAPRRKQILDCLERTSVGMR